MTSCKCHMVPLLCAKWPQKCTPWSQKMEAEKLRTTVLTWPLPCVAGCIQHLLLRLLFQPFWEVIIFVTGKYDGAQYQGVGFCYLLIPCNMCKSVILRIVEVSRRAGAQRAGEEMSVFRWSAPNERFLKLALLGVSYHLMTYHFPFLPD